VSRASATAFAPATVGNVGVGFDILGHAFGVIGDTVRAERTAETGVRIAAVAGVAGELPLEASRNTAGQAVLSLAGAAAPGFGFALTLDKGIPLGSGLGGSAASAVAAVVAANALLDRPLPLIELLGHAIAGEEVASGARHADNVAPALFGGLVLTVGVDSPRVEQIPVPPSIRCVLLHPRMFLSTQAARAASRAAGRPHRCRPAIGEPRRFHCRLLHERPGPDPRCPRGRDRRAAARVAHPRIRAGQAGRRSTAARSVARSPAPVPASSPGARPILP
jgi:hypothetical protein